MQDKTAREIVYALAVSTGHYVDWDKRELKECACGTLRDEVRALRQDIALLAEHFGVSLSTVYQHRVVVRKGGMGQ